MALNITTIKTLNPTHLTVTKKCQMYGEEQHLFLTNRTNHPYATYLIHPNPKRHLNPGDQVEILAIHPAQTFYNFSCLLARSPNGLQFLIGAPDLSRFFTL